MVYLYNGILTHYNKDVGLFFTAKYKETEGIMQRKVCHKEKCKYWMISPVHAM